MLFEPSDSRSLSLSLEDAKIKDVHWNRTERQAVDSLSSSAQLVNIQRIYVSNKIGLIRQFEQEQKTTMHLQTLQELRKRAVRKDLRRMVTIRMVAGISEFFPILARRVSAARLLAIGY